MALFEFLLPREVPLTPPPDLGVTGAAHDYSIGYVEGADGAAVPLWYDYIGTEDLHPNGGGTATVRTADGRYVQLMNGVGLETPTGVPVPPLPLSIAMVSRTPQLDTELYRIAGFKLQRQSSGGFSYLGVGTGASGESTRAADSAGWVHTVLVLSATVQKLFINGVLTASQIVTPGATVTTLRPIARANAQNHYKRLTLFNRAVTDAEAGQLAAAARAGYPQLPAPA